MTSTHDHDRRDDDVRPDDLRTNDLTRDDLAGDDRRADDPRRDDDNGARLAHDLLGPLRGVEPDDALVAATLARHHAGPDVTAPPTPWPTRRRRRVLVAVPALAAAAGALVLALPAGDDEPGGALEALRAAAAAAADDPGPAPFTGFRYVELRDRRDQPWGVPDDACVARMEQQRKAVLRGERPAPPTEPCGTKLRARYVEEGRMELWVDAGNRGVRRDLGSEVLEATGDRELADGLRKELGRKPVTAPYVYGDGAFGRVPLADLPTEPRALLDLLTAAHRDGRWATNGGGGSRGMSPAAERRDLAMVTVLLIAQSNATPELRSAAFRALALLPDVADLGEVTDAAGREGHGIAVRHGADDRSVLGPGEVRLVFDEATGEVLSWAEVNDGPLGRGTVEWTVLRTGHVAEVPAEVRRQLK